MHGTLENVVLHMPEHQRATSALLLHIRSGTMGNSLYKQDLLDDMNPPPPPGTIQTPVNLDALPKELHYR